MTDDVASYQLEVSEQDHVIVSLAGSWLAKTSTEPAQDTFVQLFGELKAQLQEGKLSQLSYQTEQLSAWDSRLIALNLRIEALAKEHQVNVDRRGLPDGAIALLQLASAVPPKETLREKAKPTGFFAILGEDTLRAFKTYSDVAEFIGEVLLATKRFALGQSIYYRKDFITFLRDAGPEAVGIIFLINFLMGVILAFLGAVQLEQFGAQIYVADMVAIGLTRELVPMMTAIVLAGRTGAAYAAQLGTMMVNQEIDALKSFGFSTYDFLVIPRMIALAVMVPLLIIFGDFFGMLGGFLVSIGVIELNANLFLGQLKQAINSIDIFYGLVKGGVFGVLVAICGCMLGIRSGRSASAVGQAATGAVVSSIVCIVIATALFSVLSTAWGI